jgi:hypothetical protein
MSNHLNIFEPYERKGAHYEDALTRAFLLVLRGAPIAHAAWLHLVDRAHRANGGEGIPLLHELVAPSVHMQTARVPDSSARIVSVVQTDAHVLVDADAKPSERRQVLDGVVGYGDLTIVIENKPWHGHIWTEQLEVNIPEGANHDPRVACVVWSDIVSGWGRLLDSGHLNTAEGVLISDFLDYVEQHFSALRPYSRVGLCGRDHARLQRRCKAALASIAGPEAVEYHRGWGWYIDLDDGQCARKLGLLVDIDANRPRLIVEIDPGDTMGQARSMYRSVTLEAVDKLLQQPGWTGWSNFHLMFMTSGFFRPGHLTDLREFWRRWAERPDLIRQWRRAEFNEAFAALLELGIVSPNQREEFNRHTMDSARQNVCFAPGVTLQWHLPLEEAARLDDRDQLESRIRAAIDEGAAAFGLRWPGAKPGGVVAAPGVS